MQSNLRYHLITTYKTKNMQFEFQLHSQCNKTVCVAYCLYNLILLRDGEATLNILRDKTAEERYLMLPELGRVLQELRRAHGQLRNMFHTMLIVTSVTFVPY